MKWLTMLLMSVVLLTGCGSVTLSGDDNDDDEVSFNLFGLFSGDTEDAITVTDKDGKEQSIGFEQDDDGSVVVSGTGNDGEETFSFGAGASSELHEDFPKDIPFPDSAQIFGTQRAADGEETIFTVQFLFEEDAKDIYDLYKDYINSRNYDDVMEMEMDVNYSLQGAMEDGSESILLNITNYAEEEEDMAVITYITN